MFVRDTSQAMAPAPQQRFALGVRAAIAQPDRGRASVGATRTELFEQTDDPMTDATVSSAWSMRMDPARASCLPIHLGAR